MNLTQPGAATIAFGRETADRTFVNWFCASQVTMAPLAATSRKWWFCHHTAAPKVSSGPPVNNMPVMRIRANVARPDFRKICTGAANRGNQ